MNQHKKSRLTVLALVALFALPLASCQPTTNPNNNNSQDSGKVTGGGLLDAPRVDVSVLPEYIETGKPVDLKAVINHQEGVEFKVTFDVSTDETGSSFSTYDPAFAGYDASTGMWTPTVTNKVVKLSFEASNSSGKATGNKSVYVSNKATVVDGAFASTYAINDYIYLNQAFKSYKILSLTVERAVVSTADGKTSDVSSDYDPATYKFTFKHKGTYTIIASLDDGVSDKNLSQTFVFDVIEKGQFITVHYLDDLLGAYPTYVAPEKDKDGKDILVDRSNIDYKMPEGYPAGKIAQNPTFNYRLDRDLDYNDPDSWEDGIIKPWVPITNGDTPETTFSGILDGAGFTIKNLTNVFPGRDTEKKVTKKVKDETGKEVEKEFTLPKVGKIVDFNGVSLFQSNNSENLSAGGKGRITNLNIENYNITVTGNDFPNASSIGSNNYAIIADPVNGGGQYDNAGTVNTSLQDVNVSGKIDVDLGKAAGGKGSVIGGVSVGAGTLNNVTSNVDITVNNGNGNLHVGGVTGDGNASGTGISYSGDISIEKKDNLPLFAGGISGLAVDSDYHTSNDNVTSTGTLTVHNQVVDLVDSSGVNVGKGTGITFVGGIAGKFEGSQIFYNSYNMSSDMDITVDNLINNYGGIGGIAGQNMYIYAYSSFYTGDINVGNYDAGSYDNLSKYESGSGVGGMFGLTQVSNFDSGFQGTMTIGGDGYKNIGGIAGTMVSQYSDKAGMDPDNEVYGSTWQQFNGAVASGSITVNGGTVQYGGIVGLARNANETALGIVNSYSNVKLTTNNINQDLSYGSLGVGQYVRNDKKYDYIKFDGSQMVGQLGTIKEESKFLLIGKFNFGDYLWDVTEAYRIFGAVQDRNEIKLDTDYTNNGEQQPGAGNWVVHSNVDDKDTDLKVKATAEKSKPYIDKNTGKAMHYNLQDGKLVPEESYYFNQALKNGTIDAANFDKNLYLYTAYGNAHWGIYDKEGKTNSQLRDNEADVVFDNEPVVKNGTWWVGKTDTKIKGQDGQFGYISSVNMKGYEYDASAKAKFGNWTYKVSSIEVNQTTNGYRWVPGADSTSSQAAIAALEERLNNYRKQMDDLVKNQYIEFEISYSGEFNYSILDKQYIVEKDGKKYIKLPVKDYKKGDLGGFFKTDAALASMFSAENVKKYEANLDKAIQDLKDKLNGFGSMQDTLQNNK